VSVAASAHHPDAGTRSHDNENNQASKHRLSTRPKTISRLRRPVKDENRRTGRCGDAQSRNLSPNIGSPLPKSALDASSSIASQCSARRPFSILSVGRDPVSRVPVSGKASMDDHIIALATVRSCSYLSVGGSVLIRPNSPSRPRVI
jgi:hypothetical protein